MIEIENLDLYVDSLQLTSGLSLTLEVGERLGITGPSGCGKSTLLKSCAGHPLAANTTADKFHVQKTGASYVPQSNGLLPWFSLGRNLSIYSHESNSQMERNQIITAFELTKNLDSFPHELSGGEYQRAILASAILNRPSMYIADEPLTELDLSKKWALLSYWSNSIQQFQASLLLVSHDPDTLLYLCNRIIVLSDKPSRILKNITVQMPHARSRDFLISTEFVKAKSELLDLVSMSTTQ